MALRIDFNEGWLFHDGEIEVAPFEKWKGPVYIQAKTERYRRGPASIQYLDVVDDYGSVKSMYDNREVTHEKWQKITLPHDYIITQEPKESGNDGLGYFDYHPAWYRKHFTVDNEHKGSRTVLYFEGVTQRCEIILNGVPLHEETSGFAPFEVDISDFVRYGEDNVLAVHITPAQPDGWWYGGAGIYRDVHLEISPRVASARYGTYIAPKKLDSVRWALPVKVELINADYVAHTAEVQVEINSPSGECVLSLCGKAEIEERDKAELTLSAEIKSPELWSIDTPRLYTVKTSVKSALGCDEAYTRFGFRTVEFDSERGFILNGENIKIKGVCGHGDFGLTGKAVPDNIHRLKVSLMKEMGANGYRCSHYPQSEYLMDEFDRQGIVVMDEVRWFSSSKTGLAELQTLIKRDRNHPSVIMWSLGNEEPYFVTEQGARIVKSMRAEAKRLDASRAIMTANDRPPEFSTVYDDSDIVGVNYNLPMFDMLHAKFPTKPILSTECCATGTTRGWYEESSAEYAYVTAYDRGTNDWFMGREKTWSFITERPWIMGSFQWISFDHRGEAVWPRLCSQSGAMDMFLAKKDAFYQNQSHWLDKPMIHLLPHWNHKGKEGVPIEVWAYTNCDEAELLLNGVSLGKRKTPYPAHAEWFVPYEAGRLEVVGFKDGCEVCRDVKETTGRAVSLKLSLLNPDIKANGKDIAVFNCTAVDEHGFEVPNASAFVRFNCGGDGEIIGTGASPSDHSPVTRPERQMFSGLATVGVKLGCKGGMLTLRAECDILDSAYISIDLAQ